MLWHGRKFDVRVWVLWTGASPLGLAACLQSHMCVCLTVRTRARGRLGTDQYGGQVHMYTHGYVRTSSDEFSLSERGKWVHLTNYCLQKHSNSFGTHEAGNTVSFQQLDTYLRDMPVPPECAARMERETSDRGGGGGTGEHKAAEGSQWCMPMRHIIAQIERVIAETGAAAKLCAAAKAKAGAGSGKPARAPLKQRMASFQAQRAGSGRGGSSKTKEGGESKAQAAQSETKAQGSQGAGTGASSSTPLRKRQVRPVAPC